LRTESRRELDGARLSAFVIDNVLIGAPLWFMITGFYGRGLGPFGLVVALVLSYHYVCEILFGQSIGKRTMGLRVVSLDGQAPSYRQVSARTVLRLVDQVPPLIGLVVLVLSRGRRQRLGDLAAGTAVVRAADHPVARRPFSIDVVAYPLAWFAPAAVVFGLWIGGHFPGSYRTVADGLCVQALAAAGVHPSFGQFYIAQSELLNRLAALHAPPNWQARHDELVRQLSQDQAIGTDVVGLAQRGRQRDAQSRYDTLKALWHQHHAVLRSYGYLDCAG
jgi:uncharacterized RDD family membrane protein YckC